MISKNLYWIRFCISRSWWRCLAGKNPRERTPQLLVLVWTTSPTRPTKTSKTSSQHVPTIFSRVVWFRQKKSWRVFLRKLQLSQTNSFFNHTDYAFRYLFFLPLTWEDDPKCVIPMSFVVYEHLEGLQLSQGFLIAGAIQWGSTSLNPSGAARGIVLGARAAGSKEAAFELLDVEVRLRTNDVTWWGPWVVEACWWLSPKKKCCEGMRSLKLTVRLPLKIGLLPQKEISIPSIHFPVRFVSFRGV